jgi:hypothetical protein
MAKEYCLESWRGKSGRISRKLFPVETDLEGLGYEGRTIARGKRAVEMARQLNASGHLVCFSWWSVTSIAMPEYNTRRRY